MGPRLQISFMWQQMSWGNQSNSGETEQEMGSEMNPQNLHSAKSLPLGAPLSQASSVPHSNSKTSAWKLKFATLLKIKICGHWVY